MSTPSSLITSSAVAVGAELVGGGQYWLGRCTYQGSCTLPLFFLFFFTVSSSSYHRGDYDDYDYGRGGARGAPIDEEEVKRRCNIEPDVSSLQTCYHYYYYWQVLGTPESFFFPTNNASEHFSDGLSSRRAGVKIVKKKKRERERERTLAATYILGQPKLRPPSLITTSGDWLGFLVVVRSARAAATSAAGTTARPPTPAWSSSTAGARETGTTSPPSGSARGSVHGRRRRRRRRNRGQLMLLLLLLLLLSLLLLLFLLLLLSTPLSLPMLRLLLFFFFWHGCHCCCH